MDMLSSLGTKIKMAHVIIYKCLYLSQFSTDFGQIFVKPWTPGLTLLSYETTMTTMTMTTMTRAST